MLQLALSKNIHEKTLSKTNHDFNFQLENKPIEERVRILILRDLINLNWRINFNDSKIEIYPPDNYDKMTIKNAMSIKRNEIIQKNRKWIDQNIELARENLANGFDLYDSKIKPVIEVCDTPKQHKLFKIFRYYWSSPYSEYVGRRIKLIIRDYGLPQKPVIGIAALGSPIIHIPERDDWIGWNLSTRTENLVYTMDAYVIGALPPYNFLLGGKLISYILASKEVRKIYEKKYSDKITLISKRRANKLVGIFTTSLYGRSSQYNRLKFKDNLLYVPIGETKGYGTLHLSDETINAMLELLKSKNILINNNFGDGPSWIMRVIRTAGDLLDFDSNFLLRHSFKRKIYYLSHAKNSVEYLNNLSSKIVYNNYSLNQLVVYWKKRWFNNRKLNSRVENDVKWFRKEDFYI